MKTALLSGLVFLLFLSPTFQQLKDVYENLWDSNMHIAKMTLKVDFLEKMQSGELQAERYMNFTLQDINYLLNVTKMLKEMYEKVQEPDDIRTFMMGRYNSYRIFADSLLSLYFLKGTSQIMPTPAMEKYLADYGEVMRRESDPIFFAVALLPCSRLWLWLATNLNIPKTSAYYTWKTSNMGGHPEKHYKAILNKYLNTTEKAQKAADIFNLQMQNEYHFFVTS